METPLRNCTPNLDGMYETLRNFILEYQGKRGYIDTQNANMKLDTIYCIEYSDFVSGGLEKYVYGVRVKNNDIEIVVEPIMRTYYTEYVDEDFEDDENWVSLRWSDVYYVPTLFNIVENLEEYV